VPAKLHADTRFGHIHMHVPALDAAESFYAGTLGLDVTQRTLPGALFFAAGHYHHHVAANTWAPAGQVPADATGLVSYTWRVPEGTSVKPMADPAGAEVVFDFA
jgi:catechol 2,3-dioxygenase